ncbi:MAG: radical SAM protein [Candidatus Aramenus sp.]|jgi:radical SAM protein with 4Fe4S-binding SPASM domain|nr:radical SAM protein [Candidatus Aramenus sp.]
MSENGNEKDLFYIYATLTCNLSCIHCYVPSSPNLVVKNELSLDEIKKFIDYGKKIKVKGIRLTGGEPLLRKDILEIINYAISKDMSVEVETNGLLIDNNFLKSVSDLNKIYISISLDGPKEVHEKIRGINTFERTVNVLRLLKQYNVKRTIVTTLTIMDWIYDEEKLNSFINLIIDLYPNVWYIHVWVSPAGRAKLLKSPKVKEIYDAIKLFYSLRIKLDGKVPIVLNVPPAVIPEEFTEFMLKDNLLNLGCHWWRIAGISSNGNVSICHRFASFPEMRAGNVRRDDFDKIFSNEILNRREIRLKGICSKCLIKEYCRGFCRADAYEFYRDFNAPHPLCQLFYENGFFNKNFIIGQIFLYFV